MGGKASREDLEKGIRELEGEQERVRAEWKERGEDLFQRMYESTAVGIARVSLDFVITEANEAYCRMLGYAEPELIGKTLQEITAPEFLPENLKKQKQLRDLEIDSFRLEKEFIRKDGSRAWGLLHANLIKDRNGLPDYFLGSVADISDRKRAEAALQENEHKYRTLFENMEQGVFYQKASGELYDVNPRALELFGLSREEFLDRTSRDPEWAVMEEDGTPLAPENHPSVMALRTGKPVRDKVVGVVNPRKKRTVWMSVSAIPLFSQGKDAPSQVFVTLHDLTERRRMQRQLAQAQKLEAIGTLAGGIAHDFNNLLSVILGNAELAIADAGEDSPAAESLLEIQTAGLRARDVVRRLLGFARPTGKEKRPVDIVGLVQESVKLLRGGAPANVDIQVKNPFARAIILADPSSVYQVMVNLCTNAFHAMTEKGGTLLVEVDHDCAAPGEASGPRSLKPGEYVRLSVTDTGAGMDPGTLRRVFDPYFTTKGVGKGIGMGLSVAHGIAESHGGAITAESEPGKGSTFSVFFPLAQGVSAVLPSHGNGFTGGAERVLLVDDEEPVLRTLRIMLERLGYRVTACNDGQKALAIFRNAPDAFDAMVTDMAMPGITGAALAQKAMEIRPDMPVALCTGFSEKMDEERAKALGISAFIAKPVERRDMARILRAVLDHGKSSQGAVKFG